MTTAAPILITMGDALGIGPEIVARAFQRGAAAGCVVVGDMGVMRLTWQPDDLNTASNWSTYLASLSRQRIPHFNPSSSMCI